MRRILYLLCLLVCAIVITNPHFLCAETARLHTSTDWELKPSLKYDTLCLLNALSGDPYYLRTIKPSTTTSVRSSRLRSRPPSPS